MYNKTRTINEFDRNGKKIFVCSGYLPSAWHDYMDDPYFEKGMDQEWKQGITEENLPDDVQEIVQFIRYHFSFEPFHFLCGLRYTKTDDIFCGELRFSKPKQTQYEFSFVYQLSIMIFEKDIDAIHFKLTTLDSNT